MGLRQYNASLQNKWSLRGTQLCPSHNHQAPWHEVQSDCHSADCLQFVFRLLLFLQYQVICFKASIMNTYRSLRLSSPSKALGSMVRSSLFPFRLLRQTHRNSHVTADLGSARNNGDLCFSNKIFSFCTRNSLRENPCMEILLRDSQILCTSWAWNMEGGVNMAYAQEFKAANQE
jgi:hypothetical protein